MTVLANSPSSTRTCRASGIVDMFARMPQTMMATWRSFRTSTRRQDQEEKELHNAPLSGHPAHAGEVQQHHVQASPRTQEQE
eukprot:2834925-Amphidinium_carterae.1